jgi:hypothetical protein
MHPPVEPLAGFAQHAHPSLSIPIVDADRLAPVTSRGT